MRAARDARDLEIINSNADQLNADAKDRVDDQAPEGLDGENESDQ